MTPLRRCTGPDCPSPKRFHHRTGRTSGCRFVRSCRMTQGRLGSRCRSPAGSRRWQKKRTKRRWRGWSFETCQSHKRTNQGLRCLRFDSGGSAAALCLHRQQRRWRNLQTSAQLETQSRWAGTWLPGHCLGGLPAKPLGAATGKHVAASWRIVGGG
jgi:hypothetical protein